MRATNSTNSFPSRLRSEETRTRLCLCVCCVQPAGLVRYGRECRLPTTTEGLPILAGWPYAVHFLHRRQLFPED